ncbi:hypothetical protein SMG44B_70136 [Stenotrophomonas maltophilia]
MKWNEWRRNPLKVMKLPSYF